MESSTISIKKMLNFPPNISTDILEENASDIGIDIDDSQCLLTSTDQRNVIYCNLVLTFTYRCSGFLGLAVELSCYCLTLAVKAVSK